jgi:hypothetical protein
MPIRVRLTLWYGALYSLALMATSLFSYSFHTRGHFDDLDRVLITSAGHAAIEIASSEEPSHLIAGTGGLEIGLRLYGADGALRESLPNVEDLPSTSPLDTLQYPAGPAFDIVAGLTPPLTGPPPDPGAGAFRLFSDSQQRWRSYVLPVARQGTTIAYVEALGPLGQLDASLRIFRLALAGVVVGALVVGVAGGWALAGGALRPVARLTRLAHHQDQHGKHRREGEYPVEEGQRHQRPRFG